MKLRHKRFKNIRFNLVLTIVFTLLFPYALLGMDSPNYRIPKNSLSYFLQNPTQKQYLETTTKRESGAVIPPLTPLDVQEASKEPEPPVQEVQTIYKSEPIMDAPAPAKETFDFAWKKEAGIVKAEGKRSSETQKIIVALKNKHARQLHENKKRVVSPAITPIVKREIQIRQEKPIQIVTNKITTKKFKRARIARSSNKKPLFSKALAKMTKRRAERQAEAEKLGVVLPSQGGDLSDVSPSLNKINKTLKNIMSRHSCSSSNCRFCTGA
jgi:hypothetical protein